MANRRPADPDVLPDAVRTRLLERASELDAAQRASVTVAELRAAATEAGISAHAFDAALAELDVAGQPPVVAATATPRRIGRFAAIAAGIVAILIAVSRIVVTGPAATGAGAPTVEQAFPLHCLSPGQAAELVRPLLDLPTNTIVASPANAPRVLTVRATPAQMESVRAMLDRYEGTGAPSCARGPA